MDSEKLTDAEVKALLEAIQTAEVQPAGEEAYKAPSGSNLTEEYTEDLERLDKKQQLDHRDKLMQTVAFLAKASFLLLAVVVLSQMIVRFFKPEYQGISDEVVSIIAVSVFGQVLVIMGALAYYLWKGKK